TTSAITPPPTASPFNGGFANQTIRQVVPGTVGGKQLRLRFSNVYGEQAITFQAVRVGLQQSGATLLPGSNRKVTFGGRDTVTIRAGAVALSDPVKIEVPDAANIVASYFTAQPTGVPTGGGFAGSGAASYVAQGNQVDAVDGSNFRTSGGAWF